LMCGKAFDVYTGAQVDKSRRKGGTRILRVISRARRPRHLRA